MAITPKYFDSKKTSELFIYIAERLKEEDSYGATLLNKAFYFIDQYCYIKTGSTVSDFRYVKQSFGPTPDPTQFLPLKEKLLFNGDIEEIKNDFFGKVQKKCIALRKPNIDVFSKPEIVLIDTVLSVLCKFNASQISEITHDFMAWKFAKQSEVIPNFTSLLTSRNPCEKDIAWAKQVIANYTN